MIDVKNLFRYCITCLYIDQINLYTSKLRTILIRNTIIRLFFCINVNTNANIILKIIIIGMLKIRL